MEIKLVNGTEDEILKFIDKYHYGEGRQFAKIQDGDDIVHIALDYGFIYKDGEIIDKRFELDIENLINQIIEYDKSSNVNEFHINGLPIWLDKESRLSLKFRLEVEISQGIKETTLWYNGISIKVDPSTAINMLYDLELYAAKTYDITQMNIVNAQNITTQKELNNFEYKLNYPEKLVFNI